MTPWWLLTAKKVLTLTLILYRWTRRLKFALATSCCRMALMLICASTSIIGNRSRRAAALLLAPFERVRLTCKPFGKPYWLPVASCLRKKNRDDCNHFLERDSSCKIQAEGSDCFAGPVPRS